MSCSIGTSQNGRGSRIDNRTVYYHFSNLPEFKHALKIFNKACDNLYLVIGNDIYFTDLEQLLANGKDIYCFGRHILMKSVTNYQKECKFDILEDLGFLENEYDPYYIERYIEEHGKEPPRKKLTKEQFYNALKLRKRHIKQRAKLANVVAVAYKGFSFFIRSYQDSIYKLLLHTTGCKTGEFSSMADIIDTRNQRYRPNKPVSKILLQSFPEYIHWFLKFRNLRNKVKTGVLTEIHLDEADPTLIVKRLEDFEVELQKVERLFSILDLIEAIKASTKLTNIAIDLVGVKYL